MTHLQDTCFIVMSQYGIQRMTKRQGSLQRGEIAVRVKLVVPETAFAEPDVSATITVPTSAIIKPAVQVTVEEAPSASNGAASEPGKPTPSAAPQ